ncbi:MAG TPA: F0F1 ATP synthase subunit alpha [Burkholderiales bacterium]|nr:F0F1 ATP synthase subunit alpha [Burkholderiales bacterium]
MRHEPDQVALASGKPAGARAPDAFRLRLSERGHILSIGDGIAWVDGLPSAGMDELIAFEGGARGLVFHLGAEALGAILLDDTDALSAGTVAALAGARLTVPVGDALVGRVIDPLGRPLDGLDPPACVEARDLDVAAPPIIARDFVSKPLYTGIKIVDAMIPIAKGQRQLIIGDDGTGKSALALDAVINQKGRDVLCVYVLIGQRRSSVLGTIETLRATGALGHTTVVVAEATATPGMKYLAPFAGCAVAEAWMWRGRDTLVVYDDLTAHARAYRELSLLLRRPPGREAYPGDIFYLHSRLLERAACLKAVHGGGSQTALPIAETEQGEIAAYVPTNLISITDGQIYLDTRLAAGGFLPAIDLARSVSRIGGSAQHPRVRTEAGRMKLDYLQFLELEVFTRFGARLETSIETRIRRGRVLREALKQPRLAPEPIEAQLAWLIAFNEGWLDDVAPRDVPARLVALAARSSTCALALSHDRSSWVQALSAESPGASA